MTAPPVFLHETHDAWPQGKPVTNAGLLPSAGRSRLTCGRTLALFFSALVLCVFAAGPCLFMAGGR